jgi:hypothetical protein
MKMLMIVILLNICQFLFSLDKIRDYNAQISFIFNLSSKFIVNEIGMINYPENKYNLYKITYGTKTNNSKKYLIISGVHGNEVAPVYEMQNFIQYLDSIELINDITIDFIYILNPYGFEYNTRYNGQGMDINRDFIELKTQEINHLINSLESTRYTGVYDFHEHSSTTGFLLYYYSNKNRFLSRDILTMIRSHNIPLENNYVDVVLRSKDGAIFVPFYAKIYFMNINRQATTGLYFDKINVKEVFVFETPITMKMEKRREIIELILRYIVGL